MTLEAAPAPPSQTPPSGTDHARPFVYIDVEKIAAPDAEAFHATYRAAALPVVMTGVAEDWPARHKWTPDFFKQELADTQVRVHHSVPEHRHNILGDVHRMPFPRYIDEMLEAEQDSRLFLFSLFRHAPQLLRDIKPPALCRSIGGRSVTMFFGCKDSVTPVHYDIDWRAIFHTVLWGKKEFLVFPPEQGSALYRHPLMPRSAIDLDHIDAERDGHALSLRAHRAIVGPGDTLFLPPGWWHYTRYLEPGYGVVWREDHHRGLHKLRGFIQLFLLKPFDVLMNRAIPHAWFRFKQYWAYKFARALPPASS